MATYVVTGVSKGIGYGFLHLLTEDSSNTVIGIVRDKATTDKKISEDLELQRRSNFHILEADLTNYDAIKNAAAETSKITGGSIDYLVANAGYVSPFDAFDPIGKLGEKPNELDDEFHKLFDTNVLGNIHLYNLFMPLILKGQTKKVIVITSGYADIELARKYDVQSGPIYAASKAAMNVITAKFSAQYRKQGVLFLSICPGVVDVGHANNATPEQLQSFVEIMARFQEYAPDFKGANTPEVATKMVRDVWEKASIENGNAGDFLSHFGTKQWL